jgi:hypothetical protein
MRTRARTVAAGAAIAAALVAVTAHAAPAPPEPWTTIGKAELEVTEGQIARAGRNAMLRTNDPGMRATERDGGRHHTGARLWFRYLGESVITEPLGSGAIRRQIGVKLRSADPCNLIYVMWHQYPDNVIEVSVKRNPGQTTSAQCGNRGYTELAEITLGPGDGTDDHSPHVLAVRTRRTDTGAIAIRVFKDGALLRRVRLSPGLAAGLKGPIGVRSDNGDYFFQLSGRF